MTTNLNLGPATVLPILVLFSYIVLLSLALTSQSALRGAKWRLAVYFAIAAAANLNQVVSSITLLRSGFASEELVTLSSWAMSAWPVAFFFLGLSILQMDLKRPLVWAIGAVWLAVITILTIPIGGFWESFLDLATVQVYLPMLGWAVALVAALALSIYQRQRTSRPRRRNRIEYWLLVIGCMTVGCFLYLLRPGISEPGATAIVALTGWIMASVLLRDPLVELKELIRTGAGYLVVTVFTVAIYFVTISVVQTLFSRLATPYSRLIGVSVAAIALTVLYEPLHDLSQQFVDRFFFGLGYDHVAALRDYAEHIDNVTELDELAVKAITMIGHAFGLERGVLLNAEEHGADLLLRVIPGMGVLDAYAVEIPKDHPLLTYFLETSAPLTHNDIRRASEFQKLPSYDKEWLASLEMEVLVPVKTADRVLGILALGPKATGEPFRRSDLELLGTLGEQTALTLRNAQRFSSLSSVNMGIAQLNEELRRLDEAKSNFLTIASHELKTPLTLIQGYTNILTTLPLSELQNQEKVSHITEGISRGTDRLRQIIDDMIDISRLDANALSLHWKECHLGTVLGLAAKHLMPSAEERNQSLIVESAEGIPAFDGDAQRLHQALLNIMENAIKFTPDGGTITVSARLLGGNSPDEQFIEIVVADTGIGIAPEDQERIFEKFYRVGDAKLHSSSKVQFKGGGPGLGLAIAKGIVEAHGGKIWAASEGYDEETFPGSEFHILLMVRAPDNRVRLVERYGSTTPKETPGPIIES